MPLFFKIIIYQQSIVQALFLMSYELDRDEMAAIILHCLSITDCNDLEENISIKSHKFTIN
jgi:hypothetical protein